MSRLQRLHAAGVSIWLDTLSRDVLDGGAFETLVAEFAVTGATSNPTIFAEPVRSGRCGRARRRRTKPTPTCSTSSS